MFQSWFSPVSFLQEKAISCLLLVKNDDQRCHLPYQKPFGHPAVLSSCELFAKSRLFISWTTWASPCEHSLRLLHERLRAFKGLCNVNAALVKQNISRFLNGICCFRRLDFTPLSALNQIKINRECKAG